MADTNMPKNDFVDISSSSEVERVYRPDSNKDHKDKKNGKKSRFALRIVSLVLGVIFLLGGAVVIYAYTRLPKFKAVDDGQSNQLVVYDATKDEPEGSTSDTGEKPVHQIIQGDNILLQHDMVLNILLFGQDYTGSKDDYGRSDTMILMSIDNIHKNIKLTSFQRDTYVYIPGYGDDKINAAFSLGGEGLAIRTFEMNFGVKVDKYASVDFDSFRKIIKVLGGIDIELNDQEIKYINAQIEVNHQLGKTSYVQYDPSKKTQVVHLDGYQALWYARDRGEENLGGNPEYSFDGDDWDRTQRQRKLIETVIKYLRTKASFGDLIAIVNEIGPMITTNLKTSEILFLAQNIQTYIGYEIKDITTPSDGTWKYSHTNDGQSIIEITDWDQARYNMAKFIYEEALVPAKQ